MLRFVTLAASPNGANRVDDVFRAEPISFRDLRIAGVASAERPAFLEEVRSRGAVDRPVNAAA